MFLMENKQILSKNCRSFELIIDLKIPFFRQKQSRTKSLHENSRVWRHQINPVPIRDFEFNGFIFLVL